MNLLPLKAGKCPCSAAGDPGGGNSLCDQVICLESASGTVTLSGLDAIGYYNSSLSHTDMDPWNWPMDHLDGTYQLRYVHENSPLWLQQIAAKRRGLNYQDTCRAFVGLPPTLYFKTIKESIDKNYRTRAHYAIIYYNLLGDRTAERLLTGNELLVRFYYMNFSGLEPPPFEQMEIDEFLTLAQEIIETPAEQRPAWSRFTVHGKTQSTFLQDLPALAGSDALPVTKESDGKQLPQVTNVSSAMIYGTDICELVGGTVSGRLVFSVEQDYDCEPEPEFEYLVEPDSSATLEEQKAYVEEMKRRKAIYDEWYERNNTSVNDWVEDQQGNLHIFSGIQADRLLPYIYYKTKPPYIPKYAQFTLTLNGCSCVPVETAATVETADSESTEEILTPWIERNTPVMDSWKRRYETPTSEEGDGDSSDGTDSGTDSSDSGTDSSDSGTDSSDSGTDSSDSGTDSSDSGTDSSDSGTDSSDSGTDSSDSGTDSGTDSSDSGTDSDSGGVITGKFVRLIYAAWNGYSTQNTYFKCGTTNYLTCPGNDWKGGKQQPGGQINASIIDNEFVFNGNTFAINPAASLVPGETEPFAAYYPSGMTGHEFQRLSPYFNTQAELTAWINEEAATLEDRLNQWREYYYGKYYIVYINQHYITRIEGREWNDCGYSAWQNRSWDRKNVALHAVRIPPKEAELGFPDAASCAFSENTSDSYEYNGCNWGYQENYYDSYDTVFKIYGGFDNLEEPENLLISICNSGHISSCYGYSGWIDGTVDYRWQQEVYESPDYSYTNTPDHWEFDNIEAALAPYEIQN